MRIFPINPTVAPATPLTVAPDREQQQTGSARFAMSKVERSGPVRAPADAKQLTDLLRARGFTGEILSTPEQLAAYARDYGRLVERLPKVVVKPVSTRDAQIAVRVASDSRVQVRARSGGHGLEGQGLSNGGMLISTDQLRLGSGARIELESRDGQQLVRVVSGAKTGELIRFLAERGLRLRNSTMDVYPGIGGAVSTAGIGQGSHRYGSMADQVMELVAVDGRANAIRVQSKRTDYSSFEGPSSSTADAILGGMGQAGVITELTFPVVPIKGHMRLFREVVGSAQALGERLTALTSKDDDNIAAIWGMIAKHPQTGQIVYIASSVRDVPDASAGEPLPQTPDPGATPGVHPAWLDIINPSMDHALRFLGETPELIDRLRTTPGLVLMIPQKKIRPDRLTLNAWNKAPVGANMLALGTFYYLDKQGAGRTVDELRRTRERAVTSYGAQPYFMDGVPTTAAGWRRALGDARYTQFLDALEIADPNGVFERLPGLENRRLRR